MYFADRELAERIESLLADDARVFCAAARELLPDRTPEVIDVGGGAVLWLGPDSPVNHAAGIGLGAPVGAEEIERLETFYAKRGSSGKFVLCPLAEPHLPELLGRRGWRLDGFENVLVREVGPDEPPAEMPPGVDVALAVSASERSVWAEAVAHGFSAPDEPSAAQRELAAVASARAGVAHLLAWSDGLPVATGELVVSGGFAWLTADTTLPLARRRGIQQALQRERLHRAALAGCCLAVTEAVPGSPSQRNMERVGFRVAYTRAILVFDTRA